jgi:hypothetical protein
MFDNACTPPNASEIPSTARITSPIERGALTGISVSETLCSTVFSGQKCLKTLMDKGLLKYD